MEWIEKNSSLLCRERLQDKLLPFNGIDLSMIMGKSMWKNEIHREAWMVRNKGVLQNYNISHS